MKRVWAVVLTVMLLASCLQGAVFAATDEYIYDIDADTYVLSNFPNGNYGGQAILLNSRSEGLLRVDLSKWAGQAVERAEIGLYFYNGSTEGSVSLYLIEDNDWDEMSVTYDTRPEEEGVLVGEAAVTELNTWCVLDITDALENDEDGILSFKLLSSAGTSMRFYSRENPGNTPYVKIVGEREEIPVTGVTVDPKEVNLIENGEGTELTAQVLPENADNQAVTWTSSNPAVATVEDGVVTPFAEGTATITVTTEDGSFTDTCVVTVNRVPVTGILLNVDTLELSAKGSPGVLTAAVVPENATNQTVLWSSSNPQVATVDNGVVTPLEEGEAIITAETQDGGLTATCTVTVKPLAEGAKSYKFEATDDTFVAGDDPGQHHTATYIYVRERAATRTGFIKMDISDIAGYDILQARLYFIARDTDKGPSTDVPVEVRGFYDEIWKESQVEFKNQPDLTGMTEVLDSVVVNASGKWYSMDITDYVKTCNNAVSLQITAKASLSDKTDKEDRVYIQSKESGQGAYVEIIASPYSIQDNDPETITASAGYLNRTGENTSGLLAAGTFNSAGTLQSISADSKAVAAGEKASFSVNFKPIADTAKEYAKLFLLKSITEPVPLQPSYKYSKGCEEFPQDSDSVSGVVVNGTKVTVKGAVAAPGNVGLTVLKPGVTPETIDYTDLQGSVCHIGTEAADKTYSFAFTMDENAPEGYYTVYTGFSADGKVKEQKFLYAKSGTALLEALNGITSVEALKEVIEPNIVLLGLDSDVVYKNHYNKLTDEQKEAVLKNIINAISSSTPASTEALKELIINEIILYKANLQGQNHMPIYEMMQDCFDALGLYEKATDKNGGSISYVDMLKYLKTNGKDADPAKKIYGQTFSSVDSFVRTLKDAILDAYNDTIQKETSSGTGSNGGGGGGGYRVNEPVITPSPVPTPTATPGDNKNFSDLAGYEWAEDSINRLAEQAILEGWDGKFYPGDAVTREEFVKMIISGLGLIDSTADCSFADVDSSQWYYSCIASAAKLGIITGISDTEFGVGQRITRQDMAVILYRAAKAKGIAIPDVETVDFTDNDQIADYARLAIGSMQSAGIVNGMGDGSFQPEGLANRAQAAVILSRLLDI